MIDYTEKLGGSIELETGNSKLIEAYFCYDKIQFILKMDAKAR